MERFSYEIADRKDAQEIVAFHKRINKGIKLSVQNILWEQWGSYEDLGIFGVMRENNIIIATQEFIPVYLREEGRNRLCAISDRTLLDPKYRGGNEFRVFYAHLIDKIKDQGCQCVYGTTYAYKAFKKFGFEATLPLKHITCVLNLFKSLNPTLQSSENIRIKLMRLGVDVLSWFLVKTKYLLCSIKMRRMPYILSFDVPSENNIAQLLSHFENEYSDSVTLRYDMPFFNWRVLNNPFRTYKFICVYSGDSLKAFAVIDVSGADYQIEDLICLDDSIVDYLLWGILSFCLTRKTCREIHFWGNYTNNAIKRIFNGLTKIGGIAYPARIHFVRKVMTSSDSSTLTSLDKWYLTPIWFPTLD